MKIHQYRLVRDGVEDQDTLELLGDLVAVQEALHQDGPVSGPWMESRLKRMLLSWLPPGWYISGPSQIYCKNTRSIRSCSWDIVVHRAPTEPLPPQASPESGYALLPRDIVAAVIDTKTNFSGIAKYARQPAFNLMNDYDIRQISFLGESIRPFILAATSSLHPEEFYKNAFAHGMAGFSLARRKADRVSAGEDRMITYTALRYRDGSCPFQRFKTELLAALERCAVPVPSESPEQVAAGIVEGSASTRARRTIDRHQDDQK